MYFYAKKYNNLQLKLRTNKHYNEKSTDRWYCTVSFRCC